MNGGLVGLLLVSIALGVSVVACWRYMLSPLTRVMPAVLVAAYYTAMWFYPHQSIVAARLHIAYPQGDQIRGLLLGAAFLLIVVELVVRLSRTVRSNAALSQQLEEQA